MAVENYFGQWTDGQFSGSILENGQWRNVTGVTFDPQQVAPSGTGLIDSSATGGSSTIDVNSPIGQLITGGASSPSGGYTYDASSGVLRDAASGKVLSSGGTATNKAAEDRASNAAQTAASAAAILKNYGLDALVPLVDQWIRGGMSWEEVQLQLYDTSTAAGKIFDQRFPAIKLRREAGLNPISPDEYVNYERRAQQLMRGAGLPPGFYDGHDDFTDLLTKDISLDELGSRINQGFVEVAKAPAEVRQAFQNFFGVSGDNALAAYFLDATKAVPALQKVVDEAKIGGAGLQFGFNLGLDRVDRISGTGATFDSARGAFSDLAQINPLFNETVTENRDLTAEKEGVDAAFGLDTGQARTDIQRRLDERKAAFSGGGGAASGQQGVYGLGTAR